MKRSELHYDLPAELIAARPAEPRDASRLLVVPRGVGELRHHTFRDLPALLQPGDLLVFNDTRVIPARFFCRRATGGRIEGLFIREEDDGWRVLLKGAQRVKVGETLTLIARDEEYTNSKHGDESVAESDFSITDVATVRAIAQCERGEWLIAPTVPQPAFALLERFGVPPLPPYIRARRREEHESEEAAADPASYQTVYAAKPGAVAAPTAGLHFTPALLEALAARGVAKCFVTLHVGLGTFAPLEADDLHDHKMHREWFEVTATTRQQIATAKANGQRVIAVGTTSCRVLESLARRTANDEVQTDNTPVADWTDLFLYPPTELRLVDAMITNFHLPESTLLALVMAFAGIKQTRTAYATAIAERYRFYSYGDAMLIE